MHACAQSLKSEFLVHVKCMCNFTGKHQQCWRWYSHNHNMHQVLHPAQLSQHKQHPPCATSVLHPRHYHSQALPACYNHLLPHSWLHLEDTAHWYCIWIFIILVFFHYAIITLLPLLECLPLQPNIIRTHGSQKGRLCSIRDCAYVAFSHLPILVSWWPNSSCNKCVT